MNFSNVLETRRYEGRRGTLLRKRSDELIGEEGRSVERFDVTLGTRWLAESGENSDVIPPGCGIK